MWHDRHKKVWDLTITEDEFLQEVEDADEEGDNDEEQELD